MNRSITHVALRALALVAFLTVAIVAAGCGAGEKPESAANQRAKFEKAAAKFKTCMKENGIEIEASFTPDGGMTIGSSTKEPRNNAPDSPDSAKFEAANRACEKILADARPQGAERPGDDGKFVKQVLAYAKCMRENGIPVPDPEIEGEGRIKQKMPDINPNTTKFEAAENKCRKVGPQMKGPGPGGGPPPGGGRIVGGPGR